MSALGLWMVLVATSTAGPGSGGDQIPPAAVTLPRELRLEEAERIAEAHQPSIRLARANVAVAEARVGEAASGLWPQVSANASYTRQTGNFVFRPGLIPSNLSTPPSPPSFKSYDFLVLSGTVQQLIYDFGQTTGRWHAAEATSSAQKAVTRATGLTTIFNVRQAFFNARAQKDLVRVARETLANQERHLHQIEGFVQVGTRPDIDLVQARTDRANAQVLLINAENAYAIARAQLNQAMGIGSPIDYEVSNDALAPVDDEGLVLDPLIADAEKARPEIAQLDEQMRAQAFAIDVAKSGYWPTLGAQGAFTDSGTALDNLRWNWNLQITLGWNLFQGFLTDSTVKEARATLDALIAQLDTLRLSIRLEVEQAYLAVRAAKGAVVASEEALANARERLRLAESRYQTGVGNVIELGDAQVALTSASAQAVSAAYNVATARAQLLRALGRR
jgi:outer membrane protein